MKSVKRSLLKLRNGSSGRLLNGIIDERLLLRLHLP